MQFIVYDKLGNLKFKYDLCTQMTVDDDDSYEFNTEVAFAIEHSSASLNPEVTTPVTAPPPASATTISTIEWDPSIVEGDSSYAVELGDQLFMRLVTNRDGMNYEYSDINTGYKFYESSAYEYVYPQGIDSPLNIEFAELPFLGNSGIDFNFPFVNVGCAKTEKGYRLYIGVNVADIYDKVNKTRYSKLIGDDFTNYSDQYSYLKLATDPKGFFKGIGSTFNHIFRNKSIENRKGLKDQIQDKASSGIGSPQLAVDVMLGIYFEFWATRVVDPNEPADAKKNSLSFTFAGVGGYIAVAASFKVSYYFLIPVIFIPAYIALEANANIMGTFGAEKDPKKNEITLSDTKGKQVDFTSGLDEFYGEVKSAASVQVSGGIGLCGILGLRAFGRFDVAGLWNTPSDLYSPWGANITISVGMIVDMFVYSKDFKFASKDWSWGSIKEYQKSSHQMPVQNAPQNANGGFTLNESGSTSSEWLGDKPMMPYALTPVNNTVLAANAYDHPDSQLITMKDGTAAPEKATKLTSGSRENYYDCMPTAICDMVTGDAIVYYIKSGRTSGDVFDIANPYTNDSVICYMIYNSEADTETKNGEEVTIPQGWLFKDFYNSEYDGDTASEEFLITNFGAQRFLDSPSFEGKDGEEFYSIPDFNAIAYNGFAVYAYSIDKDSSNDTYDDKEIML
ncbi:MAG: hypothetical protein IKQ91_11170 [Oscillospiraceae bacterium]|nr:hypothetical protein [Oscillospiraceae bacterium]